MKVTVYIEGERLDLFQDESISITQGVQDVKDISKLFADFSQSFNVPASNRNNRIFKHYYNADIDGGFDARTRKLATIDINTLDFKRGKIQLDAVKIKDGQPSEYKITFFGDAIKIKDLLGDDKLNDLELLDDLDHLYTADNVKLGLQVGLSATVGGTLYNEAIIYPLISYKRQYFYNSNPSDTTATDTLVNIAHDIGRTDGVDWRDLKPCIKLQFFILAIEAQYPELNFIGDFFESENFDDLYISLNNTTNSISESTITLEETSGTISNYVAPVFLEHFTDITPTAGFESVGYKVRTEINGQVAFEHQQFVTGTTSNRAYLKASSSIYSVKVTITAEETFDFDATTTLNDVRPAFGGSTTTNIYVNNYLGVLTEANFSIRDNVYDITVYDFLTSIFKMFNLIVEPVGADIRVQDLQSWYTEGRILDITRYIDTTKLTVEKGRVFNRFNFQFEESEQILADQYNRNNRRYYGNLELDVYTDDTQTQLLDGDILDINVIFENPVFERLNDINDNSQTTIQYCPFFDREIKAISGNPFLFYKDSVSVATNPIGFNGSSYDQISGTILMPSHSRMIDDSDTFAINFNAELSEYTFAAMPTNIYSEYYEDYVSDIFSIKRRNFKLEAILPDEILHNLKLNDRLVIEDRRYIINKLTSNLVKRKDSFELINDIYDAPLLIDIFDDTFDETFI